MKFAAVSGQGGKLIYETSGGVNVKFYREVVKPVGDGVLVVHVIGQVITIAMKKMFVDVLPVDSNGVEERYSSQ